MSIRLLDPTSTVARIERRGTKRLTSLEGKRVAFVFNQHASDLHFWAALEREVEQRFKPAAAQRLYKENAWAPAPRTARASAGVRDRAAVMPGARPARAR